MDYLSINGLFVHLTFEVSFYNALPLLLSYVSYRLVVPEFKDAPAFGVMLVAEKLGTVHVGDKVYATK